MQQRIGIVRFSAENSCELFVSSQSVVRQVVMELSLAVHFMWRRHGCSAY